MDVNKTWHRAVNDSSCVFITTMNMLHLLPCGVQVLIVFKGHSAGSVLFDKVIE